jgi:transcriptional regulator with XRE-family HTH domain
VFDTLPQELRSVQEAVQPIARNVRRLRTQRQMSLNALAAAAGVSKSTLSQLERGNGNPSVETLWALAQVLGVPFAALFEDRAPEGVTVLRLADAPILARSGRGYRISRGGGDSVTRHLVSRHGRGELEVYLVDLDVGAQINAAPHSVGVVEHVVVMSGRLDVGAEGESALLEPGDRISFPADVQHHYRALDGPARVIALLDYP